jgi:hypothetical protein
MKPDQSLYSGTSITLDIHLDPEIYDGYLVRPPQQQAAITIHSADSEVPAVADL